MVIFFYLFALLLLLSAVGVISSRNPVISVLWLIFAFCNAAGLILLLGAEFLAMMLIVIYVGAVAVLFLFVVMMLDIKFSVIQGELKKNLSLALVLAFVMICDLLLIILLATKSIEIDPNSIEFAIPTNITNVHAIGLVLYTDFILPFQISGLILFVAMISCITLTFKRTLNIKQQSSSEQIKHNKENCLKIVQVNTNSGVEDIRYD